jgi:pimeloyl-ACP methyl ester carboxylesterase
MGAVTALMMKEREPRRFEKVVADAPWIDFELLSKQELWRRADLPPLFYGYTKLVAKLFFDIEFKEADNRLRCKKLCKEPILYIFESEDTLVTKEHIGRLREACPDAEIAIFEKAGHVEAFKEMPERYTETVSRFLKSVKR